MSLLTAVVLQRRNTQRRKPLLAGGLWGLETSFKFQWK